MRPTLIFDFGNVIAFFDFEKATSKLGDRLGLSGRELYDKLGPLGFREQLQEYERGGISKVEFTSRILTMIHLDTTHEEFASAWVDIFTPNESIIPVIKSLKEQGYRLILGSNTNDMHAAHFRRQFASTLSYFDHLVLSYEVGQIKPSRDFYLACVLAACVPPSECVFIDDLEENIVGAREAGLTGIVYRSTGDLMDRLKELGVGVGTRQQS